MKKPILILFLACGCIVSKAQENLGIANSNYAPTNSMLLNPSSIVDSKTFLDINIAGGSGFVWNNYAYLAKNDFLFRKDVFRLASGAILPSYRNSDRNINGVLDLGIHGPSATLALGKHSFGLYTGVRSHTIARKIPGYLGQLAAGNVDPGEMTGNYTVNNGRLKSMSWAEFGLSYGTILHQQYKEMWTGGITVKRLVGLHSTALIIDDGDFTVFDSSRVQVNNLQGKYANTNPGWGRGGGWGIDIGVTYKKMLEDVTKYVPHSPKSNCNCVDYKYKIGASILDIGRIKFKNDASFREFNEGSQIEEGVNDLESLAATASDAGTDRTGTVYKATLPTALSGQFDYNFENDFYANLTVIYGIPRPNNFGVERMTLIGVTPRYERKGFEAALPISLYNYTKPHVGLAFRFYNVVIGTDNVIPFVVRTNVYSADLYFNVKYSMFKNPACNKRVKNKGKSFGKDKKAERRKEAKCPGVSG